MKKKGKYQVVVFTTDWCPHCTHMRDHVWTEGNVIDALNFIKDNLEQMKISWRNL